MLRKLETVEFGRAVAACAVVGFHANASAAYVGLAHTPWASPLQNGVDFFFVLSGFIIFWVHNEDVGRPELALPYLWKRFVRLFPLLWLVAGGWIALRSVVSGPPSAEAAATSLLLFPSLAEPVPIVVWTLRHEILFYLAFCVAIANRRAGVVLFGVWTLAVIGQTVLIGLGRPIGGVASLVLAPFVLDFVMGAVVARIAAHRRIRSWVPLLLGGALVVGLAVLSVVYDLQRLDTLDYVSARNLFVPLNGFAYALLLYGMVCIEDMVRVPRWGVLLGGASYAIYLVHTPVNSLVQHLAGRLGNGLGHAAIIAAGVGVGVAVHLLLEKRMTRTLRRLGPFGRADRSA